MSVGIQFLIIGLISFAIGSTIGLILRKKLG